MSLLFYAHALGKIIFTATQTYIVFYIHWKLPTIIRLTSTFNVTKFPKLNEENNLRAVVITKQFDLTTPYICMYYFL